jgi:predicted HicB family RNase H-like nuclease
MRDEYDFAGGQRGKFHRPNVRLVPPIHLEPEILTYLAERAKDKGTSLNTLVNQLLKKDIELIKISE